MSEDGTPSLVASHLFDKKHVEQAFAQSLFVVQFWLYEIINYDYLQYSVKSLHGTEWKLERFIEEICFGRIYFTEE
jgi:hypothetical protein